MSQPLTGALVEPLLDWYRANRRDLPWRTDPTPYRVWVSEIMLQQTRVEAVKPYYARFLAALPTLQALADAPEEVYLKLWEGLGYYSRVRNMHKTADLLCRERGGEFPSDPAELRRLPGIGDYTAGAIASIAFGVPAPAVDGNVLRVAARLSASYEDVSLPATKRAFTEQLAAIYPSVDAGDFTQALIELGATVCVPNGEARCAACPVREQCEANRLGVVDDLPVRGPKAKRRIEPRTVLLLREDGTPPRYALRKRPPTGLLAGLWEFPHLEGHRTADEVLGAVRAMGLEPLRIRPLSPAKHIFSHVEWHMNAYELF
jgi:A/G-specific adenine glycosylase